MPVDSYGPKNQPRFDDNLGPDLAADQNAISDWAAAHGNRMADYQSVRLALAGADLWEGLEFYERDTGATWRYAGGAWGLWSKSWTDYSGTIENFTPGSGGNATVRTQYRVQDGMFRVRGYGILGTSGTAIGGVLDVTLPVNAEMFDPYLDGRVTFVDVSGPTVYEGVPTIRNTGSVYLLALNANSAYVGDSQPSVAIPFAWSSGDSVHFNFSFSPA